VAGGKDYKRDSQWYLPTSGSGEIRPTNTLPLKGKNEKTHLSSKGKTEKNMRGVKKLEPKRRRIPGEGGEPFGREMFIILKGCPGGGTLTRSGL